MPDDLNQLCHIEGFPLGEDADILALSDPPHHTAYPNPHITVALFMGYLPVKLISPLWTTPRMSSRSTQLTLWKSPHPASRLTIRHTLP